MSILIQRTLARGAAAIALSAMAAGAQQRLVDVRTASTGAVFEQWQFRDGSSGAGTGGVSSASQLTLPVTTVVPLNANWALDAYVAYASGHVTLDRGSAGRQTLSVSGMNDAKLRLVGKLRGDNVLLTLGATLPTGATALTPEALDAVSVLAAPALRFRTPALGTGASATSGLVVAGEMRGWSLALAGSYELRGNYAPAEALSVGLPQPALRAGNALHLSLGADHAVESSRETFSVIADLYSTGELRDPESSVSQVEFRLGPSVTATYQLQHAAGDIESSIYLLQRSRLSYSVAGQTVADSWRSETEAGAMVTGRMNPTTSWRAGLDGRFHSASRAAADNTPGSFAASGILAGGLTLGLRSSLHGGGLGVEPFVRAQAGTLDLGGPTRRATGLSAGFAASARF